MEYFKIDLKNKNLARCNICGKPITCNGSSTSGLNRHLVGIHKLKKINNEDGQSSSKKFKKQAYMDNMAIDSFFEKLTIGELISKLAAVDDFSFNKITNSEFIREAIRAKGFKLPRNPTCVVKLMMEFYENKRQDLIKKINKYKADGKNLVCPLTSGQVQKIRDIWMYTFTITTKIQTI